MNHTLGKKINALRKNVGFSLIELVISIVLIGLLAAVGTTMISDSFDTATMVNASQSSAAQARYALERLEREIREIKYANSTATPATACSDATTDKYCISTPSTLPSALNILPGTDTFTFANGITNANVAIAKSGTTLTLNGTALCHNVSGLSLSFYDVAGGNSPTKTTVKFVVINLTVTDPTSGQAIAQRTRVALRNAG